MAREIGVDNSEQATIALHGRGTPVMNGEQSDLWARQTEPQDLPALCLDIQRVLDEEARLPLRAEFRFDPGMPMILSTTFIHGQAAGVTWSISRELLYRGLYEDIGDGDVQVWPTQFDEDKAWLLLESRDTSAVFELPVPVMAEWIESTYRLVSAEAEADALDWDGFLEELLEDGELPAD